MLRLARRAAGVATTATLAVVNLPAAAGASEASATFSWFPSAARLNGAALAADTLLLGDYDRIVLDSDGTFTEAGYFPVESFSLAGQPVTPAGFNDPSGGGWGAYFRYGASGLQTASPYGTPQAAYARLDYEFVGYNGLATYGFDADGNAVVGGSLGQLTTLEAGSLVAGQATFVPGSPAGPSIEGSLSLTLDQADPGFADGQSGDLVLDFVHPPGDYAFTSATTIRIAAGSGVIATVQPAAVGEPASILLLGVGLAALVACCSDVRGRWRPRARHAS